LTLYGTYAWWFYPLADPRQFLTFALAGQAPQPNPVAPIKLWFVAGGLLWIEPSLAEVTAIARADVPSARMSELEAGKDEASLEDAHNYLTRLQEQIDQLRPATTTTTTTPTTTTTTAAAEPAPAEPTP